MKLFYYGFIYSYLFYCNLVWGNSPECHLDKLLKCQKRFVRIYYRLKSYEHCSSYFPILKILTIKNIHLYSLSLFTFKFINKKLPPFFDDFFLYHNKNNNIITRQTPVFTLVPARIKLFATSAKLTAPKLWSNLPISLTNITSFNLFKKKIKLLLLEKDIHYIL